MVLIRQGVSPFLRKVPTASGATAVQVAGKWRGKRTVLEFLGPTRNDAGLAALVAVGHDRLVAYGPKNSSTWDWRYLTNPWNQR